MRFSRVTATIAVAAVLSTGCIRTVPPPPTPDKVVPNVVEPGPPGGGQGRVILDSPSGPASVALIVSRGTGEIYGPHRVSAVALVNTSTLCTQTPCAVNLPYGQHEIVFQLQSDESRRSSDVVMVTEKPSVFRHAIGEEPRPNAIGTIGIFVGTSGVAALFLGGAFAAISNIDSPHNFYAHDQSKLGETFALTGAALLLVGIPLMVLGASREQAGSSVQWAPEGNAPPPSQGVGAAF